MEAAQRPGWRRRLSGPAKNLLALIFGLALAFLVAELALAFFLPAPPAYRYPQPLHLPDPELGWVLRPDQSTFTMNRDVRTNSMGFRSDEIEPVKPEGVVRILCLGDSHTFGNGVAQDEVWPARLQQRLNDAARGGPRVESINGAVQAYDTVQEVRLLERHAPTLRPDIVILGFYINDILETRRTNRAEALGAGGHMKRRGWKRLTPYRLIYLAKRSRVVTLVRERFRRVTVSNAFTEILGGRTPERFEESWRIIEERFRRARELSRETGFRLIVFPIPTAMEFQQDYPEEQYRSRFLELARRLEIEHFDPTPVMRERGRTLEDSFIPWDGHINPATHLLIAEMLVQVIDGEAVVR